ncbi:MAG: cytochrome C [Steroidobacteraceae bacterium]
MHRAFVLAAAAALITSVASAQEQSSDERSGESQSHSRFLHDSRIATGYRITPVQLNLRGKNRLLVGLGSYIVNAQGACNDCHTNPSFLPGGDPFLGEPEKINAAQFLAGGRPFGPTLVSANITPDEDGRPAGLTFEQFEALLRTGRDPENPDRILQVMPWNVYGKMTTLDLRAIYEYLRAIPSLPDNVPTAPP